VEIHPVPLLASGGGEFKGRKANGLSPLKKEFGFNHKFCQSAHGDSRIR